MLLTVEQIKSLFLGAAIVLCAWIILPLLLIIGNNRLGLPVYGNAASRLAGAALLAIGLLVTLFIVREHLKTGRVTPVAVEKPIKFIAKGIYRYSRNPMYLAILTAFFGGWLYFGHLLLLIYVLTAIPVLHLFVVYKEEPELKKVFGKQYEKYLKLVPRWL